MDHLNNIDEMYVIHCVENEKRLENIKYQFANNEWVSNKTKIYWTCYFPFSDVAANAMLLSNKSRFLSNKNEYNLTREFYRIIKVAYLQGVNSICIFEDDFSLINKDDFKKFFNDIPKDFDIIQLSYLFNDDMADYKDLLDEYKKGNLWVEKKIGGWSNNGLILSRKGMKYFIDNIDKEFKAADIPMHESKNNNIYFGKVNQSNDDLKHYIPTMPVIYVDGIESTVQNTDNKSKEDLYAFYKKYLNPKKYNILK